MMYFEIEFTDLDKKINVPFCNSSLLNQFWKTKAAETGLCSQILRVFQNSLPPDVINICILMLY